MKREMKYKYNSDNFMNRTKIGSYEFPNFYETFNETWYEYAN